MEILTMQEKTVLVMTLNKVCNCIKEKSDGTFITDGTFDVHLDNKEKENLENALLKIKYSL